MFAATGCLAWKQTASAARLSAEHAEEGVAPGGAVARCVDALFSFALNACYTAISLGRNTFRWHVVCVTGRARGKLPKRNCPVRFVPCWSLFRAFAKPFLTCAMIDHVVRRLAFFFCRTVSWLRIRTLGLCDEFHK